MAYAREFGDWILRTSYPVAAKVHTCEVCSDPIPVGFKHRVTVGIGDEDGKFYSVRDHGSYYACFGTEDSEGDYNAGVDTFGDWAS